MLAPFRSRGYGAYAVAAASLMLAFWLRHLSDSFLGDHLSFSFFYLAVSIAAWSGGLRPALVTTAVSCLIANYYFTHPNGSLSIAHWEEFVDLLIFAGVSVVIGVLAEVSLRALDRVHLAERAKDEFIATLAHELRSPLSVIQYANELNRISPPSEPNRSSEMIERQVQRLTVMVQDLLDVSRVARGKIRLERKPVEARTVVQGAIERASPSIEGRRHELTIDVSVEAMPLLADAGRLEQALANLLTNASKYTPDGGKIWFIARPVGDSVVFTVRDNGIGIAPEMLPLVFNLFVQADSTSTASENGLGIGLALVKKLVEMHGGTVEAASAGKESGSEFTVKLPLQKAPSPQPELVVVGSSR